MDISEAAFITSKVVKKRPPVPKEEDLNASSFLYQENLFDRFP